LLCKELGLVLNDHFKTDQRARTLRGRDDSERVADAPFVV